MMSTPFKRYDAYKDSDIEWLGEVPEHWGLSRIKNLTRTKSGTTPDTGISDYYDNGTHYWVRTTDLNNGRLSSSEFKVTDLALAHYNLSPIPINSVLLAMYGGMGTIGKNAILQEEITINQSVCAILPNDKKFNAYYLWYYAQYFRPHWEIFANSARKDPNINQEAIKRLWIPLPPLPEQKAIADYLDNKTAQIDRKIDLLTQKAEQYGRLKQSLINETVTRGLDKTVAMKDSGIEWLGEIPAHWEVKRVKEIALINNNSLSDNTPASYEFDYVDISSVSYGTRGYLSERMTFGTAPSRAKRIVQKDDTIISTVRTYLKAITFIEEDVSDLVVSTGFTVISPKKQFFAKYFSFLFTTDCIIDTICSLSTGVSYPAVNSSTISNLLCIVPPYEEQKAIVDYLNEKTTQIDRIIVTIHTEIEKLRELRKTLINEVVTGKIKVV